MTQEAALKILDNISNSIKESSELGQAFEIALANIEKQIPNKPEVIQGFMNIFHCPICEGIVGFKQKYCGNCGQKLDWSD